MWFRRDSDWVAKPRRNCAGFRLAQYRQQKHGCCCGRKRQFAPASVGVGRGGRESTDHAGGPSGCKTPPGPGGREARERHGSCA